MTELPQVIFQKWGHSFEEDTGAITVYRPSEYEFPLARGRAGIEFKSDGTFIDWEIGPTDSQQPLYGRWQIEGSDRLQVLFNDGAPRSLEILECSEEKLSVRNK
ncbi:lipocalin family protein [Brevibacillus porteri]|uniref:lipocalin family protein n=1 Tax=Brevibacillus porteri TaxID=2126350 RepID=UPI00370C0765